MSTMLVLDPRSEPTAERLTLAPRLDSLIGKKVGLVLDGPWRSWHVFADRLEEIVVDHERPFEIERIELTGSAFSREGVKHTQHGISKDEKEQLAAFAKTVDAVIVGLGN